MLAVKVSYQQPNAQCEADFAYHVFRSEDSQCAVPAPTMEHVTKHQAKAASDLYRVLAATSAGDNVFLSPFSISTALSMAWGGAGGKPEPGVAEKDRDRTLRLAHARKAYVFLGDCKEDVGRWVESA